MTHQQATRQNRAGVAASTCLGELVATGTGTHDDIPRLGGPNVTYPVTVYRCDECGMRLSIATDPTTGALKLLNVYRPSSKTSLDDAARAFDLPE